MCVSRLQPRLVMARTELVRRRLVTSVMVMPIIFMHRVRGLIRMMMMRHAMISTWNRLWILKTTSRLSALDFLGDRLARGLDWPLRLGLDFSRGPGARSQRCPTRTWHAIRRPTRCRRC